MLQVEEAQKRICDALVPLSVEEVALDECLGRITAAPVAARRDSPPFDQSAMDGYAVMAADIVNATHATPVSLAVSSIIAAGDRHPHVLLAEQAARIFTGAPLPHAADAVVMQEETEAANNGKEIIFVKPAKSQQYVRRRGEDLCVGDLLLATGTPVRAGDIAALAASGIETLACVRRPRVALLATGNELVEINQTPHFGEIANCNTPMLAALVRSYGGIPVSCTSVRDDPNTIAQALQAAARESDLIISIGGVSVGDFDYVRQALSHNGTMDFWRVLMKPGKPLAFGSIEGTPVLGLPGNPVSAFVTFVMFATLAIRTLAGDASWSLPRQRLQLGAALNRDTERREFVRATRVADLAMPLSARGSGQLRSLLGIDLLLDIAPGIHARTLQAGEWVDAIVLDRPFGSFSK